MTFNQVVINLIFLDSGRSPSHYMTSSFEATFQPHMLEHWHSAITNVLCGLAASKLQAIGDSQM